MLSVDTSVGDIVCRLVSVGSPFHPKIVDPGKVYVLGGWESILDGQNRMALTVNQMRRIEFDTSLAGEGQLLLPCVTYG